MTYFDGGQALQVFNSLWYPTFDRPDAPLLGVDLPFRPKFLCIVDAQPPQGRARAAHDTSTWTPSSGSTPRSRAKCHPGITTTTASSASRCCTGVLR